MTRHPPFAITRDTTAGTGVTALGARMSVGALVQPLGGGSLAWPVGVFPGHASGATILDRRVEQTTPSGTMQTVVRPGSIVIARSAQGPYLATSDAVEQVTHAAPHASSPRIDYVIDRIRDQGVDGGNPTPFVTMVLTGTPAGTPLEPTAQLTDGDLVLAAVTVRPSPNTQILTADIADRRVFATARGGTYPAGPADTRNGAYPGTRRYNLTTQAEEVWSGSAWMPVARLGAWASFTPTLTYAGAGGNPAGSVNLGSAGTANGWYQRIGNTLLIRYMFVGAGTGRNAGTGIIYVGLPAGFTPATGEQIVTGSLTTHPSGSYGEITWPCQAYIAAASSTFFLGVPTSTTTSSLGPYTVALSPGVPGQSIPVIPAGFADIKTLRLTGAIEIV